MEYSAKYKTYLDTINGYVDEVFSSLIGNDTLISAMRYSMTIGGKRLRPCLLLAFCDIFGVSTTLALPLAFSVECIHASSLIHDDLPALDNDDFRRGKPSNHKVFGEAIAVIAGDALENLAYEHALSRISTPEQVKALAYLSKCAGENGMLGGQAYDLSKNNNKEERTLLLIDELKTANLIKAPIVMAGILAGKELKALENLGTLLGVTFQFVDDLLDVTGDERLVGKTLGKDEKSDKLTAVGVYGVEGLRTKISDMKDECLKIIDTLPNNEFIKQLVTELSTRAF